MSKALLILIFSWVSAAHSASVFIYQGLFYEPSNTRDVCASALAVAANKIERSGLGQVNNLETSCVSSQLKISMTSTLALPDLTSKFKTAENIYMDFPGPISSDDASHLMGAMVKDFESSDFYILEVGTNGNRQPEVRVLSLSGWKSHLYFGLQYNESTECDSKLGEIVADLKVKYGRATGVCAANRPIVFFVD